MTELQNKLLEMLSWIDNYCKKNHITYYVVGGTLLGACRHQGFIPWDDDIDIALPRNDYETLVNKLKNPVEHFVIESPKNLDNDDYIYPFAKLYDLNTTMVEKSQKPIKRGVYIDVFPLDGIGNSYDEALKNYQKVQNKYRFLMSRLCEVKSHRVWYKNLAIMGSKLVPSFLTNERKLCTEIDKVCSKFNYDDMIFVGNLTGSYWQKEIIEKRIFGTPREYCFENITVLGPENAEEYLSRIYGDWRKLPPAEKRTSTHDFIELDFYRSYIENDGSI